MPRLLTRERAALAAGVLAPLAASARARRQRAGRPPHADVEEFGFPVGEIELRTFSGGQFVGRFMLSPKPESRPSLQARLVAVTLADQAGRAIGANSGALDQS